MNDNILPPSLSLSIYLVYLMLAFLEFSLLIDKLFSKFIFNLFVFCY